MSRLFDSGKAAPRPPAGDEQRQARAALAAAEVDENAQRLEKLLGTASAVTPIEYARERRGRWLVEHGRAGDDYLFQLHPLKVLSRAWQDVVTAFIATMDGLFPRSVAIHYRRPDEKWEIKFFTIRVEGVCRIPGWNAAVNKAIEALSAVDAWAGAPASQGARQPDAPGKREVDEAG